MALSFTTMLFGIGAAETDTLSSIADKHSVSPLNCISYPLSFLDIFKLFLIHYMQYCGFIKAKYATKTLAKKRRLERRL
jgi:hypothetical protein